jgi:hypothetical protein
MKYFGYKDTKKAKEYADYHGFFLSLQKNYPKNVLKYGKNCEDSYT